MGTTESSALPGADRDRLKLLLIDLWEHLATLRAFGLGLTAQPDLGSVPGWLERVRRVRDDESPWDVVARWANLFEEELDLVQAARNTVAHGRPISDENLRAAVAAAARLFILIQPPDRSTPEGYVWEDARLGEALRLSAADTLVTQE